MKKECFKEWKRNGKLQQFVRRKQLTNSLLAFSCWKYIAKSRFSLKLATGKKSSLLQHFQLLQIVRNWNRFTSKRQNARKALLFISKKRGKSLFQLFTKSYLLLKEKRLADLLTKEKRILALQQEAEKLSLAREYHSRHTLIKYWKRLRVSHTRSRNSSFEAPLLSDSSVRSKSPSIGKKTDQSRSPTGLSSAGKTPRKRECSFEAGNRSEERHYRVSGIIAESVTSRSKLGGKVSPEGKKEDPDDSSPAFIAQQLAANLLDTAPALEKAQLFINQLNALLSETKQKSRSGASDSLQEVRDLL